MAAPDVPAEATGHAAPGATAGDPAAVKAAWRIFAVVGAASVLLSLNYSLVFVSYGAFGETFESSPSTLSWALTAYSITMAALLVPSGWMGDRFGRKPMTLAGVGLFVVGSALIAVAPVVGVLILGRVLQAAGLALKATAGQAIILDAFPRDRRSSAVGAMGAAGGAAAAIGPVIGGALVDHIGWRWTFFLNVPMGLLLLVLMTRRLRRDPGRPATNAPDLVGVALLAGGVGALALTIVKLDAWGVANPATLATTVTSAVLLTVLVRRSNRHPDPIIHLPLFADPQYRRGVLLTFLIGGSFSGMFFTVIRMLTLGWDLSITAAGAAAGVIPLFGAPLSFLAGRIADRRGSRAVIAPGAAVMVVAAVALAVLLRTEAAVWSLWLPIGALYGIGVGFAHAASQGAAMQTVPADRLGVGGAMVRIAMDIGGVISVAVAVALLAAADDIITGVRWVAALVAGVTAIGGLLALRLTHLRPGDPARG